MPITVTVSEQRLKHFSTLIVVYFGPVEKSGWVGIRPIKTATCIKRECMRSGRLYKGDSVKDKLKRLSV